MKKDNENWVAIAILAVIFFPFILVYWVGSCIMFITWHINTMWKLPNESAPRVSRCLQCGQEGHSTCNKD